MDSIEPIKLVNITLDIFCGFIDLIILFCMLTLDFRKDRMNRLFILVVLCNLITLFLDIGISLWNGNGITSVYYPLQAAHLITFALGPVLLIAFTCYILTFLSKKANITKIVSYAAYISIAVCSVDFIFCILNPFTHMYYYMNTDNDFQRQNWFWLSQFFSFICIALNTAIIIAHHKLLKRYELMFLLTYAALPALALAAHIFLFGFSIINFSITFTILIFYVGIQREQVNQLKQKELELTNARVDIMLSQIQPHFLFNTLTTIENITYKEADKAGAMIGNLSRYLRENMNALKQKELIPFEREIKHVEIYLSFEKERFKERLITVFNFETTDFYLPILTIQPLVENAVQHGIIKKREGGTVCITTKSLPDGVEIIIADDGLGFDPSQLVNDGQTHIGLENVQNRLAAQCGGVLRLESSIGKGTTITIMIPAIEGGV